MDFWFTFLMFYPMFLFSLSVHEVAHALTANWGGDLTATYQNRLTLNPLAHIDPIGTVLIPILLLMRPGFMLFGWARPVPVSEANFRDKAWNVVVSMAGPFSNILLVLFGGLLFSFLLRIASHGEVAGWWQLSNDFYQIAGRFIFGYVALNWILCMFNLIPVPPLDGSHVLYHFFIRGHGNRYAFWDMYARLGFFLFFAIFFFTPIGEALGYAVLFMTSLTFDVLDIPFL